MCDKFCGDLYLNAAARPTTHGNRWLRRGKRIFTSSALLTMSVGLAIGAPANAEPGDWGGFGGFGGFGGSSDNDDGDSGDSDDGFGDYGSYGDFGGSYGYDDTDADGDSSADTDGNTDDGGVAGLGDYSGFSAGGLTGGADVTGGLSFSGNDSGTSADSSSDYSFAPTSTGSEGLSFGSSDNAGDDQATGNQTTDNQTTSRQTSTDEPADKTSLSDLFSSEDDKFEDVVDLTRTELTLDPQPSNVETNNTSGGFSSALADDLAGHDESAEYGDFVGPLGFGGSYNAAPSPTSFSGLLSDFTDSEPPTGATQTPNPTQPSKTADSTNPTQPTETADSTKPTQPSKTTDSINPAQPTKTADSTNPTQPTETGESSSDPTNPPAPEIANYADATDGLANFGDFQGPLGFGGSYTSDPSSTNFTGLLADFTDVEFGAATPPGEPAEPDSEPTEQDDKPLVEQIQIAAVNSHRVELVEEAQNMLEPEAKRGFFDGAYINYTLEDIDGVVTPRDQSENGKRSVGGLIGGTYNVVGKGAGLALKPTGDGEPGAVVDSRQITFDTNLNQINGAVKLGIVGGGASASLYTEPELDAILSDTPLEYVNPDGSIPISLDGNGLPPGSRQIEFDTEASPGFVDGFGVEGSVEAGFESKTLDRLIPDGLPAEGELGVEGSVYFDTVFLEGTVKQSQVSPDGETTTITTGDIRNVTFGELGFTANGKVGLGSDPATLNEDSDLVGQAGASGTGRASITVERVTSDDVQTLGADYDSETDQEAIANHYLTGNPTVQPGGRLDQTSYTLELNQIEGDFSLRGAYNLGLGAGPDGSRNSLGEPNGPTTAGFMNLSVGEASIANRVRATTSETDHLSLPTGMDGTSPEVPSDAYRSGSSEGQTIRDDNAHTVTSTQYTPAGDPAITVADYSLTINDDGSIEEGHDGELTSNTMTTFSTALDVSNAEMQELARDAVERDPSLAENDFIDAILSGSSGGQAAQQHSGGDVTDGIDALGAIQQERNDAQPETPSSDPDLPSPGQQSADNEQPPANETVVADLDQQILDQQIPSQPISGQPRPSQPISGQPAPAADPPTTEANIETIADLDWQDSIPQVSIDEVPTAPLPVEQSPIEIALPEIPEQESTPPKPEPIVPFIDLFNDDDNGGPTTVSSPPSNTVTIVIDGQPTEFPICTSNAIFDSGKWGWENGATCVFLNPKSNVAAVQPASRSVEPITPAEPPTKAKAIQPSVQAVASSAPDPCQDSDGDGWGWDGSRSCQMKPEVNAASATDERRNEQDRNQSQPPNAQGSGVRQSNQESELVMEAAEPATCEDSDGDGWGWDGSESCAMPAKS